MLSLSEKLLLTNWAVNNGMKVFWIEHDRIGRWLSMNPWLPKLRKLSHSVTTITVSDLSRNLYVKLGWRAEDVIAIPNGIDIDRFSRLSRTSGTDVPHPTMFHLGCIARLSHEKGVDLLIEAIKDLPNVTLTIVGEGKEEHNLQKRVNQLTPLRSASQSYEGQASKRVTIVPTKNDVQTFFATIDCLVLPSRDHDPFGLVIAEAMAAGIPTILTDVCGIATHLEPDEALIVKPTVESIRNAIEEVQKKDVWKRLSEKGLKAAQERFSVAQMVEAYEDVIHKTRYTKRNVATMPTA